MKKSDLESLKRGKAEARAYLDGARDGYVAHEPVDEELRDFVQAAGRQVLKRTEW